MSPKDQARAIIHAVTGYECPVVMSAKGLFAAHAPGTDIAVTVRLYPESPTVYFTRYGMTSDPTDPETARAIFAALCHLGCA
jgi:hypothetical protein